VTTTRLPGTSFQSGRALLGSLIRACIAGAVIGSLGLVLMRLGLWDRLVAPLLAPLVAVSRALYLTVGPVWIPMALVGLRVGWLGTRAFRTRMGIGPFGSGVRSELTHLAPLFAALGLAGTVWGLTHAFSALEGGEFLDRLPPLLAGLGAAMTSTLIGLSLQIGTLLLAAYNPAWSLASIQVEAEHEVVRLDGAHLGNGALGLAELLEALSMRQPEALHLNLDPRLGHDRRRELHREIWKMLDASTPLRSPLGTPR